MECHQYFENDNGHNKSDCDGHQNINQRNHSLRGFINDIALSEHLELSQKKDGDKQFEKKCNQRKYIGGDHGVEGIVNVLNGEYDRDHIDGHDNQCGDSGAETAEFYNVVLSRCVSRTE